MTSGAQIVITSVGTGRKIEIHTNEHGKFTSVPLNVGSYQVEASNAGFKHAVRSGITLQVQQAAVRDS